MVYWRRIKKYSEQKKCYFKYQRNYVNVLPSLKGGASQRNCSVNKGCYFWLAGENDFWTWWVKVCFCCCEVKVGFLTPFFSLLHCLLDDRFLIELCVRTGILFLVLTDVLDLLQVLQMRETEETNCRHCYNKFKAFSFFATQYLQKKGFRLPRTYMLTWWLHSWKGISVQILDLIQSFLSNHEIKVSLNSDTSRSF